MWRPNSTSSILSIPGRRLVAAFWLAALSLDWPAFGLETGKPAAELSARDIERCVQQNFPGDSMILTVRMVSLDRVGTERTLEAQMWWQKARATGFSNVLLVFDNPPELRGAAVLVLEKKPQNDMFMYVPELSKTRRITTRMIQGNMMGTDFSYEDFSRLQGLLTNLESERKPDEQMDGRATFVTESAPTTDTGSGYSLIRTWVDQKTCVPLKVEFFTNGNSDPAKVMGVNVESIGMEKNGWMPREIAMKDLRAGTSTRFVIEKLAVSVPISRRCFSEAALQGHGCPGQGS
ncbi:MAG: outer membrane lipoprotein-sorting protein [Myxococcota bacterium]